VSVDVDHAFPHDRSPQQTRQLVLDGRKIPYDDQLAWPAIATLTGLPVAVALIGHDEDWTAFAGFIEHEFGGFSLPPNL
jgi:amidase